MEENFQAWHHATIAFASGEAERTENLGCSKGVVIPTGLSDEFQKSAPGGKQVGLNVRFWPKAASGKLTFTIIPDHSNQPAQLAKASTTQSPTTPRHPGYPEHPQKAFPAFAPRLATRLTIGALHLGQLGSWDC